MKQAMLWMSTIPFQQRLTTKKAQATFQKYYLAHKYSSIIGFWFWSSIWYSFGHLVTYISDLKLSYFFKTIMGLPFVLLPKCPWIHVFYQATGWFPWTVPNPRAAKATLQKTKFFDYHTVTPRNTGRQGTNKFHLLLADFRYCHYSKLKEMTSRDQGLAFVIGGYPLQLGPVLRVYLY